jgi:hypothetical protein
MEQKPGTILQGGSMNIEQKIAEIENRLAKLELCIPFPPTPPLPSNNTSSSIYNNIYNNNLGGEYEGGVYKNPRMIPKDFGLNAKMREWFAAQNFRYIEIEDATAEFIDYWKSIGKRKKNWVATWRNGMRIKEKYAKRYEGDDSWKTT